MRKKKKKKRFFEPCPSVVKHASHPQEVYHTETIAATRPQHPWRSYPESPQRQVPSGYFLHSHGIDGP